MGYSYQSRRVEEKRLAGSLNGRYVQRRDDRSDSLQRLAPIYPHDGGVETDTVTVKI